MVNLNQKDIYYMNYALKLAYTAYENNEIPIGAVIVLDDKIIGQGYNQTESEHSQSNHAEVLAINEAGNNLKDWRLSECTLYVTLEPCLMCTGLIGLSRISRLVYGACSTIFGYHLDKTTLPQLYTKHIKNITKGILKEDALSLLKKFFKQKREKSE